MKLNIQPLKETDYEDILCRWWRDWRWDPPSKDFLPEDGMGGFMVYDGDTPVCAGFMYVTNLSTCFTGTFYQHCYLLCIKTYRSVLPVHYIHVYMYNLFIVAALMRLEPVPKNIPRTRIQTHPHPNPRFYPCQMFQRSLQFLYCS